jgi:hypothetical protein
MILKSFWANFSRRVVGGKRTCALPHSELFVALFCDAKNDSLFGRSAEKTQSTMGKKKHNQKNKSGKKQKKQKADSNDAHCSMCKKKELSTSLSSRDGT